jgi:hypothetical protein
MEQVVAQDWIWAHNEMVDGPSVSGNLLQTLRALMHDDTDTYRQGELPFMPLDIVKLIASYLDYGSRIRPVSELPALLYHPTHPAKLVADVDEQGRKVFYLHLWRESLDMYVRGFYTCCNARQTYRGLWDLRSTSMRFDIHDEELGILGHLNDECNGILADWMAKQIYKNQVLYFGKDIIPEWLFSERKYIVSRVILVHDRLAAPARTYYDSDFPASGRVEFAINPDTKLPDVDVLEADNDTPLYNLIKPWSINDYTWLLLGIRVGDIDGICTRVHYMTRMTQIRLVQPPPPKMQRTDE